VEKHSSGILLFTVLNSVGKEIPVYLGDNGMRKEASPSLFLFHLQLMAKTRLFILITSLLLERLIGLFIVLEFDYGGVCTLQ